MQTVLRAARPEDHIAVAHVLIESRAAFLTFVAPTHKTDEIRVWVSTQLIPKTVVTLAVVDDEVVAVLATSVVDGTAWIEQLYVLPGYDGRGIGSQLLKHAESYLRHPIRLHTFQQNSRARTFYENRGFKAVAFSDGQSNEERCPDVLYESTSHYE
jgi:ribosomal protein S18 acetylase RimI-like enzyme